MKKYRFGIIGTGRICHTFCKALALTDYAEASAVCSRSMERAQAFAAEFGIALAYDDVDAMVRDENVDIVYIGTPHTDHADSALAAICANKAVLCEKPMALNAKQAEMVINAAVKKKVFFMEAMWTRFLPAIVNAYDWIGEGLIGEVKEVNASFS
ncbi:MAG: Gfo/Idh/MocA family oxidoreductase, partial [Clostridia bacterium]|nr:Gfo/Idh/MocA family oxidoreductase [Clostridia bacterium]